MKELKINDGDLISIRDISNNQSKHYIVTIGKDDLGMDEIRGENINKEGEPKTIIISHGRKAF